MRLLLNVNQSLESIRSNLLLVIFTVFIIAIGISALVGVHTAFDALSSSMVNNFSTLGTNTFSIQNRPSTIVMGRGERRIKYPPITFTQATTFKEKFDMVPVSITASGNFGAVIQYQTKRTNPTINVIGTDENYLKTARYTIEEGRAITPEDLNANRKVIVLGYEIKKKLFPNEPASGKRVTINGDFFSVIGVYREMGSAGSSGGDKIVNIPVTTLRTSSPNPNRTYTLNVYVDDVKMMDNLIEEATGTMRLIRKRRYDQENDFSVTQSEAFAQQIMDNLSVITTVANAVAIVTLLGASIALLNIMLFSVTERTNEIGIRKALGAPQNSIMVQFLTEAVVICMLGGVVGVLLGLILGNILSASLKGDFVVPWMWLGIGLLSCIVVGILSGIYPAQKAAKVDPIESLRHE